MMRASLAIVVAAAISTAGTACAATDPYAGLHWPTPHAPFVPDSVACDQVLARTPQAWLDSAPDGCTACVVGRAAIWVACRRERSLASLTGDAGALLRFEALDRAAADAADHVTELSGIQVGGNGYYAGGQMSRMVLEQRLATLAELVRTGAARDTSAAITARADALLERLVARLDHPDSADVVGPGGDSDGSAAWSSHATPVVQFLEQSRYGDPPFDGSNRGRLELLTIFAEWVDSSLLTPAKLREMRKQ